MSSPVSNVAVALCFHMETDFDMSGELPPLLHHRINLKVELGCLLSRSKRKYLWFINVKLEHHRILVLWCSKFLGPGLIRCIIEAHVTSHIGVIHISYLVIDRLCFKVQSGLVFYFKTRQLATTTSIEKFRY